MENYLMLFKTYDIRGKNEHFDSIFIKEFSRILSKFIIDRGENKIVVGKDKRDSSNRIFNMLIKELSKYIDVITITPSSTPFLRFIANEYKTFALNITASHLPEEYNGFKLFLPIGEDFFVRDINELKNNFGRVKLKENKKNIYNFTEYFGESGFLKYLDVISKIFKKINFENEIELMIGKNYREFFDNIKNIFNLDIKIKEDNNFYDPIQNFEIKINNGFVFDGDLDRIGLIIKGKLIKAYKFYLSLIEKLKIKKAIFEITFPYWYAKNFVDVKVVRTGRVFIIEELKKDFRYGFAGEYSYHFIVKKYNPLKGDCYSDDALINMLVTLKIFNNFDEIEEVIKKYKNLESKLISIEVKDKIKFIEELKKKIKNYEEPIKNIIEIRQYNGRILIRPSDTENKIRILLEGDKIDELYRYIKQFIPTL